MKDLIVIKAYPKINIGLNVYKKNSLDQKHQLESIFVLLNNYFYDEIFIAESNENKIDYYQNKKKIMILNDSVTRALDYLTNYKNLNKKYSIRINKNIPAKAGLGGSSTDAGNIIRLICELNDIKLDDIDFYNIALKIGSDIPFFISNYEIALVQEYGNKIIDLSHLKKPKITLIEQQAIIDTKQAYTLFDATNNKLKHNDYNYIINNWHKLNNLEIYNNLLEVSLKLSHELKQSYEDWKSKNENVYLTGSGSFLFLLN